jgi:hypothetical protein
MKIYRLANLEPTSLPMKDSLGISARDDVTKPKRFFLLALVVTQESLLPHNILTETTPVTLMKFGRMYFHH